MGAYERIVEFGAAYDKRDPNPNKNYGIHGVDLRMVLKGEKGATQFLLYTNWYLPHVAEEMSVKAVERGDPAYARLLFVPMPADLGYHSKAQRYEGQEPSKEACEYCDGAPCYYDGSGMNAERIYDVLLREGSDGVWRELEAYYRDLFDGEGEDR